MVSIQYAVDAGTGVNEDLVSVGEEYAIVLDGSTGLTDETYTDGPTDGRWYVEALAQELSDRVLRSSTLSAIADDAISAVADRYAVETDGTEPPPEATPSAAGAIVRWTADELEYFILGDCSLIIQTRNGGRSVIGTGPRSLDERALDELQSLRNEDPDRSYEELWQQLLPVLKKHRRLKNDPDGYWVFGLDSEAVNHAMEGGGNPPVRDRIRGRVH